VKLDTATVRELDVDGMLKALMVGAVVSGSVMAVMADLAAETFPAASLVQA
jgi:hypothetical protein